MNLTQNTNNFLNAVTNPFGASQGALVPDRYAGNSICLTDWVDADPLVGGATALQYTGFVAILLPSYSQLKQEYASLPNVTYQVVTFPILNTGHIGVDGTNKLQSYLPLNYETITGSDTSVDVDNCLVDGYRLFSIGLRMWPMVEVVTDTSVQHVTKFFGGTITPNTIYRSIVDGNDFRTVFKQADDLKQFAGYEGCTVRYNPFVTANQVTLLSLAEQNLQSHDYSQIPIPFIYAEYSEIAAYTDSAMVYMQARFWLEGQLSLPTPIYSNQSPIDLNFDRISQIMSRPTVKYPVVVAGHSFAAFTGGIVTATSLLSKALDNAVYLRQSYRNYVNNKKPIMRNQRKQKPKKVYRPKQVLRKPQPVGPHRNPNNALPMRGRQRGRGRRRFY